METGIFHQVLNILSNSNKMAILSVDVINRFNPLFWWNIDLNCLFRCRGPHIRRNWVGSENNNVATVRNFPRFFLFRSLHTGSTPIGHLIKLFECLSYFKGKNDNTLCRSLPQSPFLIIILWVVVLVFLSDITVVHQPGRWLLSKENFFWSIS